MKHSKRQILISQTDIDKESRRSIKQKYNIKIPQQRIQYTQELQSKKTEQSPTNFNFHLLNNHDKKDEQQQYNDQQLQQDDIQIIKSMNQKKRIIEQLKRLENIKKQQNKSIIAKIVLKKMNNNSNQKVQTQQKNQSNKITSKNYNIKSNQNILEKRKQNQKKVKINNSNNTNKVKNQLVAKKINHNQSHTKIKPNIKPNKKSANPSFQNSVNNHKKIVLQTQDALLIPQKLEYNPNILSRSRTRQNRMSFRNINNKINQNHNLYDFWSIKQDKVFFGNNQEKNTTNKIFRQVQDNTQKLPHRLFYY